MTFNVLEGIGLRLKITGVSFLPQGGSYVEKVGQYEVVGPSNKAKMLDRLLEMRNSRTTEAKKIDKIVGLISPPDRVTIPPAMRVKAGLPEGASTYAYAYPAKGMEEVLEELDLTSEPWAFFLLLGGFIYWSDDKSICGVNALTTLQTPVKFTFKGPYPVRNAAATALFEQSRMQIVSDDVLEAAGFTNSAWVYSSEAIEGETLSRRHQYPYGAFVYLRRDRPDPIFFALQKPERDVTTDEGSKGFMSGLTRGVKQRMETISKEREQVRAMTRQATMSNMPMNNMLEKQQGGAGAADKSQSSRRRSKKSSLSSYLFYLQLSAPAVMGVIELVSLGMLARYDRGAYEVTAQLVFSVCLVACTWRPLRDTALGFLGQADTVSGRGRRRQTLYGLLVVSALINPVLTLVTYWLDGSRSVARNFAFSAIQIFLLYLVLPLCIYYFRRTTATTVMRKVEVQQGAVTIFTKKQVDTRIESVREDNYNSKRRSSYGSSHRSNSSGHRSGRSARTSLGRTSTIAEKDEEMPTESASNPPSPPSTPQEPPPEEEVGYTSTLIEYAKPYTEWATGLRARLRTAVAFRGGADEPADASNTQEQPSMSNASDIQQPPSTDTPSSPVRRLLRRLTANVPPLSDPGSNAPRALISPRMRWRKVGMFVIARRRVAALRLQVAFKLNRANRQKAARTIQKAVRRQQARARAAACLLQAAVRRRNARRRLQEMKKQREASLLRFDLPIFLASCFDIVGSTVLFDYLHLYDKVADWYILLSLLLPVPAIVCLVRDLGKRPVPKFSLTHCIFLVTVLYRLAHRGTQIDAFAYNFFETHLVDSPGELDVTGKNATYTERLVSTIDGYVSLASLVPLLAQLVHSFVFTTVTMLAMLALRLASIQNSSVHLLFFFQFLDKSFLYVFFFLRTASKSAVTPTWALQTLLLQGSVFMKNSGTTEALVKWLSSKFKLSVLLSLICNMEEAVGTFKRRDPLSDPLYRLQWIARLAIQNDLSDVTALLLTPIAVTFFILRDGWFTIEGSGILVRECDLRNVWGRFAVLLIIKPIATMAARWVLIVKMRKTLLGKRTLHGRSQVALDAIAYQKTLRAKGASNKIDEETQQRKLNLTEEELAAVRNELLVSALDFNILARKLLEKYDFFVMVVLLNLFVTLPIRSSAPLEAALGGLLVGENITEAAQLGSDAPDFFAVARYGVWTYVPPGLAYHQDEWLQDAFYMNSNATDDKTCETGFRDKVLTIVNMSMHPAVHVVVITVLALIGLYSLVLLQRSLQRKAHLKKGGKQGSGSGVLSRCCRGGADSSLVVVRVEKS